MLISEMNIFARAMEAASIIPDAANHFLSENLPEGANGIVEKIDEVALRLSDSIPLSPAQQMYGLVLVSSPAHLCNNYLVGDN